MPICVDLHSLQRLTAYSSGAQRPARGPHPARNESSSGPPCPTGGATALQLPKNSVYLNWPPPAAGSGRLPLQPSFLS